MEIRRFDDIEARQLASKSTCGPDLKTGYVLTLNL